MCFGRKFFCETVGRDWAEGTGGLKKFFPYMQMLRASENTLCLSCKSREREIRKHRESGYIYISKEKQRKRIDR